MLTKFEPYKPFEREENEEKDRLKKLKAFNRDVIKYNIKITEVIFAI
jgi:hypothetical protein